MVAKWNFLFAVEVPQKMDEGARNESFSKWQLSDHNNFSILVFFKKAENQCLMQLRLIMV
jgi:hypothetical protein